VEKESDTLREKKMDTQNTKNQLLFLTSISPLNEYIADRTQRLILTIDLLRRQGNIFFENITKGQPPVVSFKYEIIMDGRKFPKPINYALTKIVERRSRQNTGLSNERKADFTPDLTSSDPNHKRPIIIIDPRSGNAPGIAGSRKNSEIGMALKSGHPVYYIIFFPVPEKGQTIEDVKNAQIKFIEKVKELHPNSPKPSVIGNCQAGWVLAMVGAEKPDLAGPMILNGSPLSYWAGEKGKHVMRYRAGLIGGSWFVSLLSDLGGGFFDGANLVSGYEALDPANTFFKKPYNLFINIDKLKNRYLKFEEWWNSYYMMTEEEIELIINKLFIENSLEKGEFHFSEGKKIDLKDLKDPIVLFASDADNVTPPQQALNWITKVWNSEKEIKEQEQIIVYLIHKDIRHMGIFVSDKVAKKEHSGIINSMDQVGYLSPGLYEMIMEKADPRYSSKEYSIRFESRTFEDLKALDDGTDDELDFYPVMEASKWNSAFYHTLIRPFVRFSINRWNAPIVKMHHPQRMTRYIYSDLNPFMVPFKTSAKLIEKNRIKTSRENPFVIMEEECLKITEQAMNFQVELRDNIQEFLFKQIYGSPFIKLLFGNKSDQTSENKEKINIKHTFDKFKKLQGGFPEAAIRMMIAIAGIDNIFHDTELATIMEIAKSHKRFSHLTQKKIKSIVSEQSNILSNNFGGSIKALPLLLKTREERLDALEMAQEVAKSDLDISIEEDQLMIEMMKILNIME